MPAIRPAAAADAIKLSLEFRIYGANAPMFFGAETGIFRDLNIEPGFDGSSGSGDSLTRVASGTHAFGLADASAALHVSDAALVVVDAVSGVMVQTEKVWEAADALGLPRLVVLNRLDRERASLDRALASLRGACSRAVIPVMMAQ